MSALGTRPAQRRHRGRGAVAALGACALVLVLLAAAYAYDHSRRDLIAPGVKAAGVPVGGLRAAEARTKLRSVLGARMRRPIVLTAHGRRFTLAVASLAPQVDVDSLVSRAVA